MHNGFEKSALVIKTKYFATPGQRQLNSEFLRDEPGKRSGQVASDSRTQFRQISSEQPRIAAVYG